MELLAWASGAAYSSADERPPPSHRLADPPVAAAPPAPLAHAARRPLAAAVEQLERTMIARALERAGGRVDLAARALGLSRKGLYLKRQRLGIQPPGGRQRPGHTARSTRGTLRRVGCSLPRRG